MTSALERGLVAGAAGTTVLNVVTYLDMVVRGRPASSVPGQTVDALADLAGVEVPGDRHQRASRREGVGAVLGLGTGLAVGVLAGLARAAGVRLPAPLAAVATGAAAMAASDVPMALLGVSDPRTWSATDWFSDALPHVAYGAAVHSTLVALESTPDDVARPASAGLVTRSALLGLATGARASLGVAGPTVATHGLTGRGVASLLGVGGELVVDKRASTPSRLDGPGVPGRAASGAAGGAALARSADAAVLVPAVVSAAAAVAGSYAGASWRRRSAERRPDWQGALVEDGVALALAALACLPARKGPSRA